MPQEIQKHALMRRLTLVMLLAMLFVRLCAQQVLGVVTNANNGGLGLANIVVLSADSTFLSGTTSDDDGNFTLKQPQQGNIIKISLIGYETKFLQYAGEESLTVQLTEKASSRTFQCKMAKWRCLEEVHLRYTSTANA